jgi:hypothetical protein
MSPERRRDGARRDAVARHWLDKQVSAATKREAAVEELLKAMFSVRFVPRLYSEIRP